MPRRLIYLTAILVALVFAYDLKADEPEAVPAAPELQFVSLVQDQTDGSSWWAMTATGELWKYNPDVRPQFYYVGNFATGEVNEHIAPYMKLELAEPKVRR